MKKILMFLWLSLQMQCQTQKNNHTNIPSINNSFEKFNINLFNTNSSKDYLRSNKNDTIYIQETQSFGYVESRFIPNSPFKLNKFFFKNGNIKMKGYLFNNGSAIGIWYFFDESGKLIKEENTDSGYLFKPKDIIKYCNQNGIKLSKGYHERDGYQTSVYKNELDGKKVWKISYLISLNKQEKEVKLTLDGQTGKVIKKEEFPYDSY